MYDQVTVMVEKVIEVNMDWRSVRSTRLTQHGQSQILHWVLRQYQKREQLHSAHCIIHGIDRPLTESMCIKSRVVSPLT